MKRILIYIVPILLVISSCSIDWNDKKDAKIAELEKQITELKQKNDDSSFKKKQECGEYKKAILEELELYNKNWGGDEKWLLQEIFYSNKE